MLARLDPVLEESTAEYERKLTRREWADLNRLLEGLYASHIG